MIKNFILLGLLTWVTTSYAEVVKESMGDAETFRVESAVKEQQPARRSVAGGKFKKKKGEAKQEEAKESTDSEVRYWQYSE